jgi:hypothetical protein
VALDLLDGVFLLHVAFEPTKGTFQRLTLLQKVNLMTKLINTVAFVALCSALTVAVDKTVVRPPEQNRVRRGVTDSWWVTRSIFRA